MAQYTAPLREPEGNALTSLVWAIPASLVIWAFGFLLVSVALKGCP